MSTASFISAFAATMLVVGVVFVALSSDVHTQTAVSSNQERPTGKPFQQMASTELFVGSCEDAIIAVQTTATAITTGIVAAYAECAAEAFNITGKHDTKKCVEGLELACATTASQIAALGALKATCTDSLPSLGCGKSLTLALEASSTLTATCATTLTTCGNLRGPLTLAACLASVLAYIPETFIVPGHACQAVHACNDCSAPRVHPSGQGNNCNADFIQSHAECSQFGPDISCCSSGSGDSKQGPNWICSPPNPGGLLPPDLDTVAITAYGTQQFCCPEGATDAVPCATDPPSPPTVYYKCLGGKCVPSATGVSMAACKAACA